MCSILGDSPITDLRRWQLCRAIAPGKKFGLIVQGIFWQSCLLLLVLASETRAQNETPEIERAVQMIRGLKQRRLFELADNYATHSWNPTTLNELENPEF